MELTIKDYFLLYNSLKNENKLKTFTFLHHPKMITSYLKINKSKIIKKCNYSFLGNDSNVLLEVFNSSKAHFVWINSSLTQNLPPFFDSVLEYENYLSIYGTFAVLLDQSFSAENLSDSRIYHKDLLKNLTNQIYFDDAFRINLSGDVNDEVLKFVFYYGYDFFLTIFGSYMKNELDFKTILKYCNKMSETQLQRLFKMFQPIIFTMD